MIQKLNGIMPLFSILVILLLSQNSLAQSEGNNNKKFSTYLNQNTNGTDNIVASIFTEDFFGRVLPEGWTNVSNIGGNRIWSFDNPGHRTISGPIDANFAIFDCAYYGSGTTNSTLTTRAIDVSGLSNVYFGFFQHYRNVSSSYCIVEASNNNINWTLLDSITSNTGYPTPVYTEYDVTEIATGHSNIYFRWTFIGTDAFWWAIDNVVVYEPDLYPNPAVNVSPMNGTSNIAISETLNWTNDGGALPTGYKIYFGTDGEGLTPPINIEDNTDLGLVTTYTPESPLSFNTTYYWMIVPYSAVGDATGNVIWSFTTAEDLIPEFSITPDLLEFENTAVGSSSILQMTISNSGDVNLVISDISSSNGQFTFSPSVFPITIPPDNNQLFDITFTPEQTGDQFAVLTITHNASGSPVSYPLRGTGVDAGPIFIIDHSSLNFGNINPGSYHVLTVNVSNPGTINPLIITDASIEGSAFTVEPSSATINAGENQTFTVTFTPPAEGLYEDILSFTDNAAGSPHTINLTGNGVASLSPSGLIFEKDSVLQLEDDSYVQQLNLMNLAGGAHAIQFTLVINSEVDDNTILTFQNIQKGEDVSDDNWVLNYSVFRGPITLNGSSIDTAYILLYNLDQTAVLSAGDYEDLFQIKYKIADLAALQDSLKSSMRIVDAKASTYNGNPIDITPSTDDITIIAKNRVSSLGDVNGDGCLDILDLIMVVDHIVHKDSLTNEELARADIAPWPDGTISPNPDGIVNVQDLSLIQYIILSKVYPDGITLNGCNFSIMEKVNGSEDAIVTLYINKEGITAYLDSKVEVRGAQIEFGNLSNDADNLVINTELGGGYFMKENNMLKTVLYDRLGEKYIEAGDHFMADMPLRIINPQDISIDKIILVDNNKNELEKIGVEIVYGNAPSLPLDYILYQNYPNPFNPVTIVKFQVPQTTNVSVKIYDMLGQEIRTLYDGQVQRGTHTLQWDGLNDSSVKMSSGTYIYRIKAGDFIQSKKMLLLK
jgi:hypothetical protein